MDFFFDARTKSSLRSQRAQGQERSAETVSECYFNYYLSAILTNLTTNIDFYYTRKKLMRIHNTVY
jgi:hypothetical protein